MSHRAYARSAMLGAAGYFVLSLLMFIAAIQSCALKNGAPGMDVAAALNAYARTINPAQRLVREGCERADRATLELERQKAITHAQADQLTAEGRTRCDALVETFEAMRLTHDRATEAYERGEYARAREQLEALASLWADAEPDGGTR